MLNDNILFQDSFTEASNTTLASHTPDVDVLGYGWTKIGWSGTNGESNSLQVNGTTDEVDMETGGDSQGVLYGIGPVPYENIYIQGVMGAGSSDDTHHFFLRVDGTFDNYYALRFSTGVLQLVKNVGGTPTTLGTGTAPSAGNLVRMEIEDDVIRVYVNGILRIKVQDSDVSSNGVAGYGAGQLLVTNDDISTQQFDDFEVGVLETTKFYDSFFETSNTELSAHTPDKGSSWDEVLDVSGGSMTVNSSDYLYASGSLSDGSLYRANVSGGWANNQAAQAHMRDPDSSDNTCGLAVRIQDSNNFYYWKFNESECRVYKKVAGSITPLGSELGSGQVAAGDWVRMEIEDDNIRCYVNDTKIIDLTDSDLTTGSPGIGTGAVIASGDDQGSAESFWTFWAFELNTTQTVTAKASIYNQVQQTATAKALIVPRTVEYTPIDDSSPVTLDVYEGTDFVCLIPRNVPTGVAWADIKAIADAWNASATVIKNWTGRQPTFYNHDGVTGQGFHYNGKPIAAVVPTTCGAGCAYVGFTGLEILQSFFDDYVWEAYDQLGYIGNVACYEMGRNYFHSEFLDRLEYVDDDVFNIHAGVARFFAFYALVEAGYDGQVAWNVGSDSVLRGQIEGMLADYIADGSYNWNNTMLTDTAYPNAYSLGASDLWCGMMMYLEDTYGGIADSAFWNHLYSRGTSATTADSVDNWFYACCAATGEDLTTLFETTWKIPLSTQVKQDVQDFFNKTVQAKGHIWHVTKYHGVEDAGKTYDAQFREWPENQNGWGISQNGTPSIRQFAGVPVGLRIRQNASTYYAYYKSIGTADNEVGTTIEAEIRWVNGDEGDLQMVIQDGTKNAWLHIYNGAIKLNSTDSYALTTTDYHVYRMVQKDDTTYVYVDGTLVLSNTNATDTGSKFAIFGDYGFGSVYCEYYIKNMWISTRGAYAPTQGQGNPYGVLGMQARARISHKIDRLSDNFNDNSIDTDIWNIYNAVEQNGALEAVNQEEAEIITRRNATTTSPAQYLYDWDITESSVFWKFSMSSQAADYTAELTLACGSFNDFIRFTILNGTIYAYRRENGGSTTEITSTAYNATTHKWLRFRESGGTLYLDYSSDSYNWNNLASYVYGSTFKPQASSIYFYINDSSLNKTTTIDNFNWNEGTQTATAKGNIVFTYSNTVTAKASITKAISSLYDDFNDNSIDTNKWSSTGGVSETNQQIEMSGTEEFLYTGLEYNLIGDEFIVQCTPDTANASYDAYITFGDQTDDYRIIWYIDHNGTMIVYRHDTSDSPFEDTVLSTAYNSTNHKWLRIRESGGTIYFDASADSRNWSNLGSFVPTANFLNAMKKARLDLSHYDESGLSKTTIYDNFNTYNRAQTVTASGNIRIGGDYDIWAKASIHVNQTRTITANAVIDKSIKQYINAKGRVERNFSQEISSKSSILRNFSKEITSKARISVINERNLTSKGRIEIQSTQQMSAKGDIFRQYTSVLTANALITVLMTQTSESKANIRATQTKTIGAKARLGEGAAWNLEAKASIQRNFNKTLTSLANIRATQTAGTLSALGNIRGQQTQSVTAKGVIGTGFEKIITSVANIRATQTKTIQAIGSISAPVPVTIQAKSNIVSNVEQTVTAKGWIGSGTARTITAKGNIDTCLLDQSYTAGTGFTAYYGTNARPYTGQQFTVSRDQSLCKITLTMAKVGSPTDNTVVEIWTLSGGLPDTKIGESNNVVDNSTLPAAFGEQEETFTFAGVPMLQSGVQYAFVLKRSGSLDDSNYILAYSHFESLYAGGDQLNYDGADWTEYSANDVWFMQYGQLPQEKTQTVSAKASLKLNTLTVDGLQARARIIPSQAFVSEAASTVRQIAIKIEVKWDGSSWTDESLYFMSARGNEKLQGDLGEGVASTLDIELDNTTERFTPDNSSSPIYAYLKPRTPIRVSITMGGYDYRMFTGYIKNIHPDTRTKICSLECFDNQVLVYNKRANGIVYEDLRTDQLMIELADLAGLDADSFTFDSGDQLVNYGYFEDRNVWPLMGEIAVAERGRVFFDRYGELQFWNRSRLHNRGAVETLTLNDWITDLDYSVAEHEIKNAVIVMAAPRFTAGIQVVWSNGNAEYLDPYSDTLVYIPAYTGQNVFLELEDPCTTFITPIANTDFTANSAQDGTGDDLTANIEITEFTNYGNAVFMTVENKGSTGAYLTQFQLRGNPARVLKWIKVTARDENSIDDYGRQEIEIENHFITSEEAATTIADEELERRRGAINLFRVNIIGIPYLLTGDVVSVEYRSGEYKDYMIQTLDWTFDESGFNQRLTLTNPYSFPTVKTINSRAFIIQGDRVAHVTAKANIT